MKGVSQTIIDSQFESPDGLQELKTQKPPRHFKELLLIGLVNPACLQLYDPTGVIFDSNLEFLTLPAGWGETGATYIHMFSSFTPHSQQYLVLHPNLALQTPPMRIFGQVSHTHHRKCSFAAGKGKSLLQDVLIDGCSLFDAINLTTEIRT